MQDGDLTRAWTTASAHLPQGYKLTALIADESAYAKLGQLVMDPRDRAAWYAIAEDDKGRTEFAGGSFPNQALRALAHKLEAKRGDANG